MNLYPRIALVILVLGLCDVISTQTQDSQDTPSNGSGHVFDTLNQLIKIVETYRSQAIENSKLHPDSIDANTSKDWIKEAIQAFIKDKVRSYVETKLSKADTLKTRVKRDTEDQGRVKDKLMAVKDKLQDRIKDKMETLDDIKDKIQDRIEDKMEDLDDFKDKLEDRIEDRKLSLEDLKDKVDDRIEDRKQSLEDIKDKIDDRMEYRKQSLEDIKDKVDDRIEDRKQLLEDIKDKVDDRMEDIKKVLEDLKDRIEDYIQDRMKDLEDFEERVPDPQRLFSENKDKVEDQIKDRKEALEHLKDRIDDYIEERIKELKNFEERIPDYIKTQKQSFSEITDKVEDWIKDRKEALEHLKDRIEDYIEDLIKDLEDFEELTPDYIEKRKRSLSEIRDKVKEHIKDMVERYLNDRRSDGVIGRSNTRLARFPSEEEFLGAEEEKVKEQKEKERKEKKEKEEEEDGEKEKKEKDEEPEEEEKEVSLLARDIVATVKNLKSKIMEKVLSKKEFVKSKVLNKLNMIAQALQDSSVGDDNDDMENTGDKTSSLDTISRIELPAEVEKRIDDTINALVSGITEKFNISNEAVLRGMILQLLEDFASDIQNLQESWKEFLQAKQEMVEAAAKLHDVTATDSASAGALRFKSLMSFQAKLREMIQKKKEFVEEKVQLKMEVVQTLKNMSMAFKARTKSPISYFDVLEALTDPSLQLPDWIIAKYGSPYGQTGNFSDTDGLQLAAAIGDRITAQEGGHSTIIAVVLVACLAIVVAVGVVGVVVVKQRRRQRLYRHVPTEPPSPSAPQYGATSG